MSISAALNSAISGLSATSMATELVSVNIANAMTPGYGVRSLTLASSGIGPGVQVIGVHRHSNPVLIANRRVAEAEYVAAQARADFFSRAEYLIGTPDSAQSIGGRLASFDASLISAASKPDSPERLQDVVNSALGLTKSLNSASEGVRDMRNLADRSIGTMVDQLNAALRQVQDLNTQITALGGSGGAASLLDQRQQVIDQINQIVPISIADRPNGQVTLYSEGGAILLDGQAATIGFDPVTETMPHMTVENGALSGLTLNGIAIETNGTRGPLRGGALGAQFAIRDELAVELQADLDAVARDLVERFEDPALDPTIAAGMPGLFADGATAFDPADEIGLAGRVSINPAVDPLNGGETWRLRDGLGAAAPGAPGDASLLQGLSDALTAPRVLNSGDFGSSALSAASVSNALMSRIGLDTNAALGKLGFSSASLTELSHLEQSEGVDTDAEMQSLLILEQAYAANAKVIQAVDEMMDALMRL